MNDLLSSSCPRAYKAQPLAVHWIYYTDVLIYCVLYYTVLM
jgi:hypothetical protein